MLETVTTDPAPPAIFPATKHVRKPALPALTGLRTLLAINIVLFHFTPPHLHYLYPVIDHAFVFVGCFFLISGFILAYNYTEQAETLDKRGFYMARLARIYPTYLLVLLLSWPLLLEEWKARSHTEFWQGLVLTPLTLQAGTHRWQRFGTPLAGRFRRKWRSILLFPFCCAGLCPADAGADRN